MITVFRYDFIVLSEIFYFFFLNEYIREKCILNGAFIPVDIPLGFSEFSLLHNDLQLRNE